MHHESPYCYHVFKAKIFRNSCCEMLTTRPFTHQHSPTYWKVKVKLSLGLTKRHAMKTYGGVKV